MKDCLVLGNACMSLISPEAPSLTINITSRKLILKMYRTVIMAVILYVAWRMTLIDELKLRPEKGGDCVMKNSTHSMIHRILLE